MEIATNQIQGLEEARRKLYVLTLALAGIQEINIFNAHDICGISEIMYEVIQSLNGVLDKDGQENYERRGPLRRE